MKSFGNLVLRIAICIAVVWIATKLTGLIGLALSAPIWGVMLAKPILEFFPALERIIHRSAFEEWEGKYYKYGRIHLRAYFDGDDAWFNAQDVLSVLDKTPATWRDARFTPDEYRVMPGRTEWGFSPAGVIKLTHLSGHAEAPKFRLWFERAVIYTLERKRLANSAR
jgi:hypothetical protein